MHLPNLLCRSSHRKAVRRPPPLQTRSLVLHNCHLLGCNGGSSFCLACAASSRIERAPRAQMISTAERGRPLPQKRNKFGTFRCGALSMRTCTLAQFDNCHFGVSCHMHTCTQAVVGRLWVGTRTPMCPGAWACRIRVGARPADHACCHRYSKMSCRDRNTWPRDHRRAVVPQQCCPWAQSRQEQIAAAPGQSGLAIYDLQLLPPR